MLTLSQKLAAGIAATTAVATVALAAPQVQAQTAESFFGSGLTVTSGIFSATGIARIPDPLDAPLSDWTANLFASGNAQAVFTVSRSLQDPITSTYNGGVPFQTWYSHTTSGAPFRNASLALDLVGLNSSLNATGRKEIYSDAAFTNLIGLATVSITGGIETSVDATFTPLSTIYIKDIIDINGGFLSSYTNSYAVPEPMTMLGASAAVAFGAAFKRRQAKKG